MGYRALFEVFKESAMKPERKYLETLLKKIGVNPKEYEKILNKLQKLTDQCPQCKRVVGTYWSYCGVCGLKLPLPEDLDLLDMQEKSEQEHSKITHEVLKRGHSFCIYCGKKL